jgi:CRP/FNR family transcriptional regulator
MDNFQQDENLNQNNLRGRAPGNSVPQTILADEVTSWESKCSLYQSAQRLTIEKHASVNRKGEPFKSAFIVRTGQFKLISENPNSAGSSIVRFIMPGDIFGLDALAGANTRSRAIALEKSEVSTLPFSSIRHFISADKATTELLLSRIFRAHQDDLSRPNAADQSAEQRFAAFLVLTSKKYSRLGYSDKTFRLAMSRTDIADYICIAPSSLSRLIAKFSGAGILRIDGRIAVVEDMSELRALAGNA